MSSYDNDARWDFEEDAAMQEWMLRRSEPRSFWVEVLCDDGAEYGFPATAITETEAKTKAMQNAREAPWFLRPVSAVAYDEE